MNDKPVFRVILKPCPWCSKTPEISMPLELKENTGGSLIWEVYCGWHSCHFKPKGKHIVLRKNQRFDLKKIQEKLNILCSRWNYGCTLPPYEALEIPLEPLLKFINKNKEK